SPASRSMTWQRRSTAAWSSARSGCWKNPAAGPGTGGPRRAEMARISVEEALERLLDGVPPLGSETVPRAQANGRALAADLAARRTQPPFPASAMDGYAVRAEDIAQVPAVLRVIGEAPAGHGFAGCVGPGEAVRIFTGAPVPEGAGTSL